MGSDWQETEYGLFNRNWERNQLSEVCAKKNGIQTGPFGSQLHQRDYVNEGTPIITVEHLGENRIIYNNLPMVSDEDRDRLSKYDLRTGDIVFSRVGSVDRRSLVRTEENGWLFSGRCLRVRPQAEFIDSEYLSYFFGLSEFKDFIRRIAVGATMPSLNTKLLSDVPIYHPPLPEQQAIAHILGSLDDKIELNRQMNKTLEAMAQAIFKSWFVDFDPVRAKAEGRDPGLPKEIADLFPDSLEDSDLGEIPKGWNVRPIGDIVRCVGGSTPSTKDSRFWEGGTNPFVTPKDMSSLTTPILLYAERHITNAGVERISSHRLPVGTVLLSSRAPIGYLAITEVQVSVNQGIIAMICDGELPNLYVLFLTASNMETIKSSAGGTTFAEISKRNFRPILAIIPTKKLMNAFVDIVEPLYQKMVSNLRESNKVTSIHNSLLPKLISGKLRVQDTTELMERTA